MGANRTTLRVTPVNDADGIAASQTLSGGGAQNFNLNGALVSGGKATFSSPHRIVITSAGNDSGRTFTITGKNHAGQPVTEAVTGANAGAATSVLYFKEVSQVSSDDDTAGAVTIGVTGLASSPWYVADTRVHDFDLSFAGELSSGATLTYTVQATLDDVQDSAVTPVWFDHPDVAGENTNQAGNYTTPITATRLIVTAFTSGTVDFSIVQAR